MSVSRSPSGDVGIAQSVVDVDPTGRLRPQLGGGRLEQPPQLDLAHVCGPGRGARGQQQYAQSSFHRKDSSTASTLGGIDWPRVSVWAKHRAPAVGTIRSAGRIVLKRPPASLLLSREDSRREPRRVRPARLLCFGGDLGVGPNAGAAEVGSASADDELAVPRGARGVAGSRRSPPVRSGEGCAPDAVESEEADSGDVILLPIIRGPGGPGQSRGHCEQSPRTGLHGDVFPQRSLPHPRGTGWGASR